MTTMIIMIIMIIMSISNKLLMISEPHLHPWEGVEAHATEGNKHNSNALKFNNILDDQVTKNFDVCHSHNLGEILKKY